MKNQTILDRLRAYISNGGGNPNGLKTIDDAVKRLDTISGGGVSTVEIVGTSDNNYLNIDTPMEIEGQVVRRIIDSLPRAIYVKTTYVPIEESDSDTPIGSELYKGVYHGPEVKYYYSSGLLEMVDIEYKELVSGYYIDISLETDPQSVNNPDISFSLRANTYVYDADRDMYLYPL